MAICWENDLPFVTGLLCAFLASYYRIPMAWYLFWLSSVNTSPWMCDPAPVEALPQNPNTHTHTHVCLNAQSLTQPFTSTHTSTYSWYFVLLITNLMQIKFFCDSHEDKTTLVSFKVCMCYSLWFHTGCHVPVRQYCRRHHSNFVTISTAIERSLPIAKCQQIKKKSQIVGNM